ncbi:hypothetical protein [Anaerorhabdus sp.]|uniref:hypothetical protein n=1 Tax=Anaerorhabdus sp. TaxID=1872524 RepID=UPI002B211A65|nr:hypothetical protein [Anaerorhabdus sp.]MEA4875651.1 hypothetical protein [Anaerorhabdus sp.]
MLNKRKSTSTRKFLNLKSLTDFSITGYNNQQLLFYSIAPYNLSVLSEENIESKIFSLMNLIKGTELVEILCLNSRENFRFNKLNIRKRIEEEQNLAIRNLLELDLNHIDQIQVTTATARSFIICIRIPKEDDQVTHQSLNRLEKALKQFGFSIIRLNKDELKTMLAVYYEQNVTTDKFEDIDGERWLKQ